jgi:regulator of ribosome biosynthesis
MAVHLQALTIITNKPVTEEEIDGMAREQLNELVSSIRKCTSTRENVDLVHLLPESTISFPRQCLREHVETRWERFARAKGIKGRKGKMVFDEELDEWIPRFGPYSKKNLILRSAVREGELTVSALRRVKHKNVERNDARREANRKRRLGL